MTTVSSEVPTHGNYHNYHGYRYHHPGGHDSRPTPLPHGLLTDARVPDVCFNEGLGLLRNSHGGPGTSLELTSMTCSCAWPSDAGAISGATKRPFLSRHLPALKENGRLSRLTHQSVVDYFPRKFPASCQHMFGPLPIPPGHVPLGRSRT
ncbi:hypothetical protein EDB85DRAFT_787880 [Lactarius pseudohatsudake]|nr:hypothetical protein EDB85DRAFT_787880 [Lactarius pseudohatsudake]